MYVFRHENDHRPNDSEQNHLFRKLVKECTGAVATEYGGRQFFKKSAFNKPLDVLRRRAVTSVLPEITDEFMARGKKDRL